MVKLNLYGLLAILEIILVVAAVAVTMFFKWRGARRDVAALRQQLREAPIVSTPVTVAPVNAPIEPSAPPAEYADFLREQIDRSSTLLGEDTQSQAKGALGDAQQDEETHIRQMLAARHQFLQLELDAQNAPMDDDVQAQRQRVVAGMQALLDGLNWKPAAQTDTGADTDTASTDAPTGRSEVTKLQEQIGYLRSVIDNQHSVMRELRQLLEEHGGDSEDLQAALRKLGDAEAQAVELHRCLEVIEQENERLKGIPHKLATHGIAASPDADMLRDLVGNQQRTIGKLQSMLRNIVPDSGRASELEEAISKIQRSNNELNSCVMVLEDENSMLRGQVESLQERLANLEAVAVEAELYTPNSAPESFGAADIDSMLAEFVPELPASMAAPTEPLTSPSAATEADTTIDIDALLEAAAASGVSETTAADQDIDALLESFARDAAPIPAPVPQPPVEKTAPVDDDTDALLADLFGDTPSASR